MKVLVTGGAGFIGSHVAERLLRDGHDVAVLDNESTGRRANVPAAVRYHVGDVRQIEEVEPAFAEGLDAVCHIAGQVSLALAFADPLVDLRTNVEGTVNVLGLAVKHRVGRVLYASSMTAYGRTDVLPIPETAPCQPISYYGITKYAAERYVHSTAERVDLGFALHVTSFRMYNVYGPRQALDNPYQGVLGIFKLDENLPIELLDDLRAAGHEADGLRDEDLIGAPDDVVLDLVRCENRVLLTLDKGIADVRAYPPKAHAGIVLFRPPAAGRGTILSFVRRHLVSLFERDLTRRLLVITDRGLRLR